MHWSGEHLVAATPQAAFARLLDPAALATAIPGCDRLEPSGPGTFRVHFGDTLIRMLGAFEGKLRITDVVPGKQCLLALAGQGAAGLLRGTTRVRIEPREEHTLVRYETEMTVEGILATVGGRTLLATARDRAEQFFAGLGGAVDPP